jgi:hypothetical protein
MAAVANNPAFAKKVGISKSVGEEFMKADKTKKFGSGGSLKAVDSSDNPELSKLPTEVRNKMGYMKKGGMAKSDMKEDTKMDKTQDKAMIKKAFKQHDAQEHKGGKGTKLALKKGGMAKKMAMGGPAMQSKTNMRDEGKKSNAIPYVNPTPTQTGSIGAAFNSAAKMASGVSGQPYTPIKTLLKKGGMTKGCGYSKGGQLAKANGVAVRGKTKGKII